MKYKLLKDINFNPFSPNEVQNIIFKNREVDNIIEFMSPVEDHLLDPFLLDHMKEGINLLNYHIENNNDIFIIVDSDVDGYTSASIIYNYIKKNFPATRIKWMVHDSKAHGINIERIPENTKLVICPDSSSNEYEKHKKLAEQKIDVLVIDHHEASQYSEHAVVINNQLSKKYPNKNLSGAGVAFKFCEGMEKQLSLSPAFDFIDLAAMGIIADMMDVRNMENRYIIQQGLKNIKNYFFKTLIAGQKYSLGSQALNSIGIMFYISPLINAVTRVGTLEEKETMFSAFINGEKQVISDKRGSTVNDRETIAEKAVRYCKNAKNKQKKLVDGIKEEVEITLEEQDLSTIPIILVKLKEICNTSLTGLVANQLASKYKRPVLLLVEQGDKDKNFLGSGRNYGLSEVENLKDCLRDTKLFEFAEGHQSAFGAKIKNQNIEVFLDNVKDYFPEQEEIDDTYSVDFIIDAKDFNANIVRQISKLRSLWGKGFDEPIVAVENIPVDGTNLSLMGKNKTHIKFVYNEVVYVKFHLSQEELEKFKDKRIIINVVGRCDVNVWQDSFTYQIIIQDYEITEQESEYAF